MRISSAIATLIAGVVAVTASDVTYNVVSPIQDNQVAGVIVDGKAYSLAPDNSNPLLFHTGKAPAASQGYKYAVLDKANASNVVSQEPFTRSPTNDKKTPNEYYGRSWNSMNLPQLPTIMNPLPIIHRISTDLHIDGQIPTIHITGNQSTIDNMHENHFNDVDVNGLSMTYISPNDVKKFDNITLSVAGFSSRTLSKLSYKLKLPKKTDLYEYRRFKLRSIATDLSYMREELAYNIMESIGLPSAQYSYVRLYMNNRPLGLFGFADNFKKPWTRNVFGDGKKKAPLGTLFVSSPNSDKNASFIAGEAESINATAALAAARKEGLKPSKSDLSYLGNNLTAYMTQYTVREDPSTGTANYTRLIDLTKFISEQSNVSSSDAAAAQWDERIDVTSFLRGLAMEVVTSNSDGYLANANNYLLYDDPVNNRFVFTNQDFDLTMGTAFIEADKMHAGNYSNFPGMAARPLVPRLLAVPKYKNEFDTLVYNITKQLVNKDVLFPRIDALYNFLLEDVQWDKSCPPVTNSSSLLSSVFGTGDLSNVTFMFGLNGTVENPALANYSMSLKNWIEYRSTNLLSYFNQTGFNTPA